MVFPLPLPSFFFFCFALLCFFGGLGHVISHETFCFFFLAVVRRANVLLIIIIIIVATNVMGSGCFAFGTARVRRKKKF